jgi:hypothetical protein
VLKTRTALFLITGGLFIGGTIQLVISGSSIPATPQHTAAPVVQQANSATIHQEPATAIDFKLVPPKAGAPLEQWIAFAHQVKNTNTGSQHHNRDYTTPLLPWYVYIARQSPEAIYTLYQDRSINSRIIGHLIQFGLLPNWYEELEGAQQLLLREEVALIHLAVHRGSEFARAELISLIRENEGRLSSVEAAPLRFALSGMQDHEVDQLLTRMSRGEIRIDPRSLRGLMQEPRLKGRESEMLAILHQQEGGRSSSRSMSSYFLHGAELGDADYVQELITDVHDNDQQPTNFYCAACALALVTDGLMGRELVEAAKQGRGITVTKQGKRDQLPGSTHEYQLNISDGGQR